LGTTIGITRNNAPGELAGMTLPRRFRLSGQTAFSNVFQQAVVSADASFKVLARGNDQQRSRLGMAVSRKVDKRAVARNRLKRVIRESFREHYRTEQDNAADVVVLPRRQAVGQSNQVLFEQLTRHWKNIDDRVNRSKAPDPRVGSKK
jgi:ribonuclease P protein component